MNECHEISVVSISNESIVSMNGSGSMHVDNDISNNLFSFKYQNINGLGDKLLHDDIIHDVKQRHLTIFSEAMKGPDFEHSIDGYSVKSFAHSSHEK